MEAKARAVPGVQDARVDLQSMELVVTGDAVDLRAVIEALKASGVDASER